jgi:AbrB family looped-hinge helix DNA binding protein
MTLRIDKAGRIVIPKPVRDHWGLHEGSELELVEGPEGVLLKPATEEPALVYEDGLLVHTGKLPPGMDWDRLIEEDREDRIRKLAGF